VAAQHSIQPRRTSARRPNRDEVRQA
jgi:hypothetical protein